MAVIEVWKCDNCGKIIDNDMDVYSLHLESLGKRFVYDGYERDVIQLHFCWTCAKRIVEALENIAKKGVANERDERRDRGKD